jgi:protoporphyrinogen oxidase
VDTNILIVGGGIAGLTAAWILRRKHPTTSITVIERAAEVGGLLTTYDYGEFGLFDCGMHWITETGVADIDELYRGLLPEREWVFLEGARRDLSGLFYRGALQENTQFPDLRRFDREQYISFLGDFFENLNNSNGIETENLLAHARARFGRLIADNVVEPIACKVHGQSGDQLDVMARFLPLLDRVVLFDEHIFLNLMGSSEIRARLAFPEQRRLPSHLSSGRGSFYPRRYGIKRVVDALVARLRDSGVEILTNAHVSCLQRADGVIRRAQIECGAGARRNFDPIGRLVWTADAFVLAKLLGSLTPQPSLPGRRTVIVSLLLRNPPRMSDLYCFFCADAPYATYRVTNFNSFCPDAPRAGGYPISVELLVDASQRKEETEYAIQAISEILAFGLIEDPEDVFFARAEPLRAGFPSMTLESVRAVDLVRAAIEELAIDNLIRGGILARANQFFQHDVLIDLYRQICDP